MSDETLYTGYIRVVHIRRPMSAYAECGLPFIPAIPKPALRLHCDACYRARKAARRKFGTGKRRLKIWHVSKGLRCVDPFRIP